MNDLVKLERDAAKAYAGMLHDGHATDCREAAAVIEELTEALIDARPYLEAYAQQNAGTATHLQDMMNALFAKIDAALTKAQGDT